MTARVLDFHFDYLSPYSYLAWERLKDLGRRHELRVQPRPTLLAALLNHWGHKGPGEMPAKRPYMFKDCIRLAAQWNVPLAPPHSHPFNPLASLRATLLEMDPGTRRNLVDRLFAAVWAESLDVGSAQTVARICAQVGVPNALARIQDPAVKELLRRVNDEAIERGVFGVPTMIVDGELFWGTDSLPHLERYLEGQDPIEPRELAKWLAVPPTAHRARGGD